MREGLLCKQMLCFVHASYIKKRQIGNRKTSQTLDCQHHMLSSFFHCLFYFIYFFIIVMLAVVVRFVDIGGIVNHHYYTSHNKESIRLVKR